MKIAEVEHAVQARMPVQYLAVNAGWLADGWHDARVAGYDSDPANLRVWLNVGNSGRVTVEGKKAIKERIR